MKVPASALNYRFAVGGEKLVVLLPHSKRVQETVLRKAEDNPLELLARRLHVHSELSEASRSAIVELPHTIHALDPLAYAVRDGARSDQCAVLLEGYAIRQKTTGDGSRQILAINIPGDALDFQNLLLREADHNVQMLTRGVIARIAKRDIEELAIADPNVWRAIMKVTVIEASIFREWAVNIGRRDSRRRIAHLLCEFAYRLDTIGLGEFDRFDLPITQEQLADATGLTPVHVNRVLKALEREGLIERDRRMIRFPNDRRIREVGDFDPLYLHSPATG